MPILIFLNKSIVIEAIVGTTIISNCIRDMYIYKQMEGFGYI
jgi:hypothetical protein